jgi:hypothetical protein
LGNFGTGGDEGLVLLIDGAAKIINKIAELSDICLYLGN